jgi:hypothetical protein
MDFNKLEPEALTSFVNQSLEQSSVMKQESKKYQKSAKTVLQYMDSQNLLHKIDLSKENLQSYAEVFTDAVDGSMQKYPKPDGNWLYFYSVSRIRYPSGYKSEVEVKVTPTIKTINQLEPKRAAAEAEEFMMNMETEAIKIAIQSRNANDGGLIFLDGPIIDPPLHGSKLYVQRRTFAINEAFSKNIMVIGIVKRIMGNLFTDHYKSYFSNQEKTEFENLMSDKIFAVHVLTDYLRSDKEHVAFSEPFIMADGSAGGSIGKKGKQIATSYREKGVDVITFLMANGYVGNPIRVDIGIPSNSKVDVMKLTQKAIRYVVQWAAPGRHLPIPVILAHEKCNIRQGAAEILYNEFITGSKSNDEDENIIQMKMMGDVH